jgi:hypothetical protein
VQITNLQIDFNHSNVILVPAELTPPLAAQRFAMLGRAQFGIACPPEELVNHLVSPPVFGMARIPRRPVVKVDHLRCFSLSLVIVGHLTVTPSTGPPPVDVVGFELDGVEIVVLFD